MLKEKEKQTAKRHSLPSNIPQMSIFAEVLPIGFIRLCPTVSSLPLGRCMKSKVCTAHGVCLQSESKPRANKDGTGRSEVIQRYLAAPTSDQIKNCQVSDSLPRFGCNILIRKLVIIFFN